MAVDVGGLAETSISDSEAERLTVSAVGEANVLPSR